MIQYFNAGDLSVALDLDRAEVRQTILELEIWSRLAPAGTNINATADDGGSAIRTVSAMATLVDSNGVTRMLDKVEARELAARAVVARLVTPVRA